MFSARLRGSFASGLPFLTGQFNPIGRRLLHKAAPALVAFAIGAAVACAQDHGRTANIASEISSFSALPDHVPSWANESNLVEAVSSAQPMEPMTLVLARHPDRERAFEKLLADQQDPASPEYHHWLTPTQIGERYGLSTGELETLTGWLQSQGLHVDWVAPARNFIGFSGAAGDVGRAFQTRLNYYKVNGKQKFSVTSPPLLPANLAPMIESIHGLYTIENKPMYTMRVVHADWPELTSSNGENFLTPWDFNTIYGGQFYGLGITIGIVARSKIDPADLQSFRQELEDSGFRGPIEVIPTAFGGVDPGNPYLSPPGPGVSVGDQAEATLDVFRAGSFAQPLLVVTSANHGDIEADAQYLIQTEPVPAQVMNISFGNCESAAGPSGVDLWNRLFEQAAGEGISTFVASGDAGASGCDAAFATPPANPAKNSPNYICSSSYATCVGGTEFNDRNDPSRYWSQNGPTGYIPEGGWNEPLNADSETQVAASGGGVSEYIPTPAWQTGTGVPSARAGRYTPDVAFTAAQHDGYFGCFAAGGGGCVPDAQGELAFVVFSGTSAAAPGMAGIAAALDNWLGGKPQGSLNPLLYSLAADSPSTFHDVTVSSSGVAGCNVDTPSMCNNSIPGSQGLSGGQAGYEIGAGFDEVTGLGSVNITNFLKNTWARYKPVIYETFVKGLTPTSAVLAARINPGGQGWYCQFSLGSYPNFSGQAFVSGATPVEIDLPIKHLYPGSSYTYYLSIDDPGGGFRSSVRSFTALKLKQSITFNQPVAPIRYGSKPIDLLAASSSGLPISYRVTKGAGRIERIEHALVIEGAGEIVVEATQLGNYAYLAAEPVRHTFVVTKAQLTVSATDETMKQGSAVPQLRFHMTGFVNGDTRYTATRNAPALSTKATSQSPPGQYPIDISAGRMTSTSYDFKFVNGWMTVTP
jgi:Pro-kumamolisin, activation domain/MBG domain (YGX type)